MIVLSVTSLTTEQYASLACCFHRREDRDSSALQHIQRHIVMAAPELLRPARGCEKTSVA